MAAVAGGLRAAGVDAGDRVCWQLPNSIDAVVLYRACWRLGAIAAPIHHLAGAADVERIVATVEPRAVIDAVPDGPPVMSEDREDRDAVILFTSGSSGSPKCTA